MQMHGFTLTNLYFQLYLPEKSVVVWGFGFSVCFSCQAIPVLRVYYGLTFLK